MEQIEILESLFNKKMIRILKTLLKKKERQFYLKELANVAHVSVPSTFRIMEKLVKLEIVSITKISKFKLYRIAKNPKTEFLTSILKEDIQIINKFVEKAQLIKGIVRIIVYGKEQEDRANVLLVGKNIDPGAVKALCSEIKEKHNFTISSLSLTEEQYIQMSAMGMYPGEKKIVYER